MSQLLQTYVTARAHARPDAVALVLNEERLTYGQLESASNRLAGLLRDCGCARGDRVGLLMPKVPAAIVGMLGILKADCVYVPMDPGNPVARLAKILDACAPRLVLVAGAVNDTLDQLLGQECAHLALSVGRLDRQGVPGKTFAPRFTWPEVETYPEPRLNYANQPDEPAHILFTSGSTGTPKGVVITHANVSQFVRWATTYFGMEESDRVSGHSPLQFDLSTFDIYGTLAVGAQLHLVPPALNILPNKLAAFIRAAGLTQWFSVPSILNYLAKFDVVKFNDFPALRRILWCGEVFPTPALRYWMERLPRVRFTNLYGPTEATIASSYYTVPECPRDDQAPIPIGRACAGEELLVLDDELRPVPPGVIGSLYIGGVGLSPGYWRDPEKTRAAFVPKPGATGAGERIYKTGDLASVGPDGLVYFHGRADTQVKSRGYRIELGEIEAALSSLAGLRDAAVVSIESRGFEGALICCAYVPVPGAPVTPAGLSKELGRLVPSYMLPARWLAFDRLPLNGSGKTDRPKLREEFREYETKTHR
jgi:amino acid adenylation domain-containing protein